MSQRDTDLDLVEYVVIAVPELSSTVDVATALRELVESSRIRILDLVGVTTGPGGRFSAIEPEQLSGLADLRDVEGEVGGLLSEDDIAPACELADMIQVPIGGWLPAAISK